MSELNEMGNMLMNIALQYTHPNFSDMYHDWGAVFKAGEELVEMDKEAELNDNQKIVLEWLESKGSNYTNIFYLFEDLLLLQIVPEEVAEAFKNMMINKKEQLEVVKAFAEWGLEHCQTTDTGE